MRIKEIEIIVGEGQVRYLFLIQPMLESLSPSVALFLAAFSNARFLTCDTGIRARAGLLHARLRS
jgi:hypothetical protein